MAIDKKKISADAAQTLINGMQNLTGKLSAYSKNLRTVPTGTAAGTSAGTTAGTATASGATVNTDYGALADKYMKEYENSKFSYDFNDDPVYQAAKQAYINQGQLAAKNVAAQAAALTGGYANSYGTAAAQQQFNQSLQNLNEIIPELQDAAYSRYQNDLAKKQNLASWYLQNSRYQKEDERYADETAYNRNRDKISDERYADETAYNRNRDKISDERYADETAYNRNRDKISDERYADETAYNRNRDKISDERYADETAYNRNRDKISDERYADETAYNRKTAEEETAYNRSQAEYEKQLEKAQIAASLYDYSLLKNLGIDTTNAEKEYALSLASKSSSGTSSGASGSSSRSSSGTSSGSSKAASGTSSTVSTAADSSDASAVNSEILKRVQTDWTQYNRQNRKNEGRDSFMTDAVSAYVERGEISAATGLAILDKLGVSYSVK